MNTSIYPLSARGSCLGRPAPCRASRRCLGRRIAIAPSHRKDVSVSSSLITFEEVQAAARRRGLDLSVKELGPFYRIVCRDHDSDEGGDKGDQPQQQHQQQQRQQQQPQHQPQRQRQRQQQQAHQGGGRIVGLTTGFVAPPFGIMHCDTLQVFTRGLKGDSGQRIRGGALGLGLLLGGATFAHGLRRGCRTAEILAINDDDGWHQRLVRYYGYFGFRPVVTVGGNGLSDLPHMLVWGGEGTRMDADVEAMLRKWTPALRRLAVSETAGGSETAGSETAGSRPTPDGM